ncbi:MAG TPA: peptidoglycan bridge formation glycyltransferase FemA/FemB family protein [Candidatus Dojkabacteria bacterium]|nr:peptidoglycan bridge formation glycyltransferase FemA/FemB family protein [Candidatus Dojkabacteria bacterium]HQG57695.1 peptidoglycan bridge formation glycyltransferase FemA/FemB family protein [Candidatus Dojkabacteria bacterium]
MIVTIDRKPEFNNCVQHPLQSWQWGDFKSQQAFNAVRLARVSNENQIIEAIQVLFRKLPLIPYTIGFIAKSHIPSPELMNEIKDIARKNKAIFVKFEPEIIVKKWMNIKGNLSQTPTDLSDSYSNMKRLKDFGLIRSKTHTFGEYSFILDVDELLNRKNIDINNIDSEQKNAAVLENMDKKARYAINYSQKHGVAIKNSTSDEGIEAFNKLNEETMKRQHFVLHTGSYFRKMLKTLNDSENRVLEILNAEYESETITSLIFFRWKDTLYYPYGASSDKHRNLMSTNLLLSKEIEKAIENGLTKIDFWGSLGPVYDQNDSWAGFHKFKQSFGPDLVQYIGSWDLVLNKFFYFLYSIADKFRKFAIKIKSYIK